MSVSAWSVSTLVRYASGLPTSWKVGYKITPQIIEAAREAMSKKIDQLFQDKSVDAKERCRITHELIDEYTGITGETPPARLLERMATYILKADTVKKYRHKHRTDYKVLSNRQIKARKEREIHLRDLNNRDKKKINIQITRMGKEKYCQDAF